MSVRRRINRPRTSQAHILFATTGKRPSRQTLAKYGVAVLLLGLSLTAVGLGTHYVVEGFLRRALYENPHYALRQIVVDAKGGAQRKQVVQATRLQIGQNLMAVDLKEVEQNVDNLPYIAQARVQRILPDTIRVEVTERQPLARIVSQRTDLNMREVFYLDRDGVAVKPQANESLRGLPEIVGGPFVDVESGQRFDQPEVQAALGVLKQLELTPLRADFDVAWLDLSHPLAVSLMTRDGAQILFRLDNLSQQMERLQQIIRFAQARQRRVALVDLTPDRNVPVRFRN
ncbi:MAG: FtsQ-type POTRA domain-containing protein [Verrucomicrobium sp.]|nr:FtsQ-type POTRA domain-containing protein [Verrucomicrobium sp.]